MANIKLTQSAPIFSFATPSLSTKGGTGPLGFIRPITLRRMSFSCSVSPAVPSMRRLLESAIAKIIGGTEPGGALDTVSR